MAATVIGYTLPAMQLVCHLVALGNNSGTIPTLPPQHEVDFLPEGYVAYPDIGFAYKFHNEIVVWVDANEVCLKEGARLAVLDSTEKKEYLRNLIPNSKSWLHTGIVRFQNSTAWTNVNTGNSVSSTTWDSDNPYGHHCVLFYPPSMEMSPEHCNSLATYFCELPITTSYTMAVE